MDPAASEVLRDALDEAGFENAAQDARAGCPPSDDWLTILRSSAETKPGSTLMPFASWCVDAVMSATVWKCWFGFPCQYTR